MLRVEHPTRHPIDRRTIFISIVMLILMLILILISMWILILNLILVLALILIWHRISFYKMKSDVRLATPCTTQRSMYGLCMDHAWSICGLCMDYVLDHDRYLMSMHELSIGYVYIKYGWGMECMDYV